MSYRVHKQIGYGLVDLKLRKGEIDDDRINPNGFLLSEDDDKWSIDKYANYLDQKYKDKKFADNIDSNLALSDYIFESSRIEEFLANSANPSLSGCIVRTDSESGMAKVLCITPIPMFDKWIHHDDDIDYYEELLKTSEMKDSVKFLNRSLYPWSSEYWDTRTGKVLKEGHLYPRLKAKRGQKKADFETEKFAIARYLGFESVEEADLYLKPAVPRCVQELCEYCELFNNPITIRQLQPILYTRWS